MKRLLFEDFLDATELARMLMADHSKWSRKFSNHIAGALNANERLALPGGRFRRVWVTGDATPERIATVDWTHKYAAEERVQDFLELVMQAMGGEA